MPEAIGIPVPSRPVRRTGYAPASDSRFRWVALDDLEPTPPETATASPTAPSAAPSAAPGWSYLNVPAARRATPVPEASSLARYLHGLHLDPLFTYTLSTVAWEEVAALPQDWTHSIINVHRVNDILHLNRFLETVNRKLPVAGLFVGCVEALEQVREKKSGPAWWRRLRRFADFVGRRVCSKLRLTRRLYFALTKGRNRVFSKAEVLGRLVRSGFEIVGCQVLHETLYFTARKVGAPARDAHPDYGLLLRLRRIGRGGRPVRVYKVRTMYAYSEYLQAYVYAQNRLQRNGKFQDDFRITAWGRSLRKVWIDELPMLLNWLKGDVKLVGIRPLSPHYLSLYPEDLVARRLRHKPGLVPPFYADLPEGFEAILRSEERYLAAYEAHPWRTDLQYLFRALHNIVIRRVRSK